MIPFILAWDQAPHWGKKEKTISVREKKSLSGEGKGWWTFPYPQTTARLSSLADIFCISPHADVTLSHFSHTPVFCSHCGLSITNAVECN